jgi:hypothetical protein
MRTILAAASLVAILALVGCSPTAPTPAPTPQAPGPSATPDVSAPAVPASPSPSAPAVPTEPPVATPEPTPTATPVAMNRDERYLEAGILRGAFDCEPVRANLPPRALAGIECDADDRAVARVGFYLFEDSEDLLRAYFARMASEGIAIESGACGGTEGEGAYIPWEGNEPAPNRHGCFINDAGFANYRATLPDRVYIGILGSSADMQALADFAWKGNQDMPGNPTLWGEPR